VENNFADRFQDFHLTKEVIMFAQDPFTISQESDFASYTKQLLSSVEEGPLQLELVDIQLSHSLKQDLQNAGAAKFWTEHIQQDQFAGKLAILFTLLGCTYTFSLSLHVHCKDILSVDDFPLAHVYFDHLK
ncbi:UNVERIFIED_CONTAM: hypothetical protein FKN15_021903, partial [Acipenser sinensis]